MTAPLRLLLTLGVAFVLAGCAEPADTTVTDDPVTAEETPVAEPPVPEASTLIGALGDSGVSGEVTFMAAPDGGLQVSYFIAGLTPGRHGFHVHENGSCEAGEDGTPGGAAGGHYAPMGDPHGARTDSLRHVGDFGNIEAGADGRAMGTFVDPVATLDGANSIVGKAVVVHANADDLESQPSGDAGSRVGCGVIGMGSSDGTATPGLPPGHPPIGQ